MAPSLQFGPRMKERKLIYIALFFEPSINGALPAYLFVCTKSDSVKHAVACIGYRAKACTSRLASVII